MDDKPKMYLSKEDLALISLNAEKLKVYDKEREIFDMKTQMLKLQNALIDSQREVVRRDAMIVEYQAIQNQKDMNKLKEKNKEFLQTISKKYPDLEKKKWGYNPETGEIQINDEDIQPVPE